MVSGHTPIRKPPIRVKRQKAVAEGRRKQVVEFSRKMTSLGIGLKKLPEKRKAELLEFLSEKGVDLKRCNFLLGKYLAFINRYRGQAAAEAPFEAITAKEERAALRQMKLLVSAVKQAKEQGLL